MPFRLLAITQAANDPSTRYRLNLHRPGLAAVGVEVRAVVWPVDEAGRRSITASAADFDGVLIQRRLLPVAHVRALRKAARRLAFDFDDAVTHQDSAAKHPWILLDKLWQFRTLVECCDAVTAGNAYLADMAGSHAPRGRVTVVPTVLDADKYQRLDSARFASGMDPLAERAEFFSAGVVGWIGQRSTLPYLEQIAGPLRWVAGRRPGLVVRCVGDAVPEMPGVKVELHPWSEAGEAAALRALDVGVAPLPNDVWTRGKCGLRLLQYLAAGVPAVASPVSTQGEITAAGAALPARNRREWAEQLHRLLGDAELRARLAAAGRELVRRRFTPEVWTAAVRSAWCGRKGLGSAKL